MGHAKNGSLDDKLHVTSRNSHMPRKWVQTSIVGCMVIRKPPHQNAKQVIVEQGKIGQTRRHQERPRCPKGMGNRGSQPTAGTVAGRHGRLREDGNEHSDLVSVRGDQEGVRFTCYTKRM